jgi:hypothetical protein
MGVLFATRRTVVQGKPELLLNGDYEDYTGTLDDAADDTFVGWTIANTGAGDVIDATATVHTGANAVKITLGNDGCNISQDITVVPGSQYQLTFWTRGDGAVAGLYAVYDVSNAANIIAIVTTGISGATYTRLVPTFTTPAGCVTVRIYFLAPALAGDAYFDDASVRLL